MNDVESSLRYEFSGQLTRAEFLRLQATALPGSIRWMPWLMAVAAIGLLGTGGFDVLLDQPCEQLPRLALALFLAGMMIVAPRLAARRAWSTNALVRGSFSGAVTTEGLEWVGEFSVGKFPWAALRGYRLRSQMLLVYSGTNQAFWLLPRLFKSPEDWAAAAALIRGPLKET